MTQDNLKLAVALNGYGVDRADGGHGDILPWEDLLGLARLAERTGYERIYTPESAGREAFSTLAGFAMATRRIGLTTGVILFGPRDPLAIGMGASSLDEMSGGRFVLGMGFRTPIDRARKAVAALRAALAGEEATFEGGDAGATGRLDWSAAPRPVPIQLAALGPRMLDLAAEVADGAILNWCTPERVAEARRAVGDRSDFVVAVYVRACITGTDGAALDALRIASRRYLALPHYRRQFDRMGVADEAAVAEATCVWGTRERALERLAEYSDAGADLVVVYPVPVHEPVSSISGTMLAAAPDPAVEA
jgi:alkanesulfonate monooxygenase SsuD/methylene tetrahydromethanopterin reductase-like flavin-dependent oxidoreductase (luciferase family)